MTVSDFSELEERCFEFARRVKELIKFLLSFLFRISVFLFSNFNHYQK